MLWDFQKRIHKGTTKSLEISAHTKHPRSLKSPIFIPSNSSSIYTLHNTLFPNEEAGVEGSSSWDTISTPHLHSRPGSLQQQRYQALQSIRWACSLPDHLSIYSKKKKDQTSLEFIYSFIHSQPLKSLSFRRTSEILLWLFNWQSSGSIHKTTTALDSLLEFAAYLESSTPLPH